MQEYVYARYTMNVTPSIVLTAGEVWRADAPLVRAHPDWFSDDWAVLARTDGKMPPVVEEATAEPGVRRARRSA